MSLPRNLPGNRTPSLSEGDNASAPVSTTSSEDDIRNLKSSLSVDAAFQASGLPSPPSGIASIIAAYVKSATRSISYREMANMTPGSGSLGTSASAGVDLFLGMLTTEQRDAFRQGRNPFDPAAMAEFIAKLQQQVGGGVVAARSGIGERYNEVRAAGSGLSDAVIADYSRQYSGMNFDQRTINTFAAVQLGVTDFRAIERIWGRAETLKAAKTAETLHFQGKEAVQDVAGISDKERGLYVQYQNANTQAERDQIKAQIHALPPRRGEEAHGEAATHHERQDRNLDRIDRLRGNALGVIYKQDTNGPQSARSSSRLQMLAHLSSSERRRLTKAAEGRLAQSTNRREEQRTAALDDDVWGGGATASPRVAKPASAAGDEKTRATTGSAVKPADSQEKPLRPVAEASVKPAAPTMV